MGAEDGVRETVLDCVIDVDIEMAIEELVSLSEDEASDTTVKDVADDEDGEGVADGVLETTELDEDSKLDVLKLGML